MLSVSMVRGFMEAGRMVIQADATTCAAVGCVRRRPSDGLPVARTWQRKLAAIHRRTMLDVAPWSEAPCAHSGDELVGTTGSLVHLRLFHLVADELLISCLLDEYLM